MARSHLTRDDPLLIILHLINYLPLVRLNTSTLNKCVCFQCVINLVMIVQTVIADGILEFTIIFI